MKNSMICIIESKRLCSYISLRTPKVILHKMHKGVKSIQRLREETKSYNNEEEIIQKERVHMA